MNRFGTILITGLALNLLSTSANALEWKVKRLSDKFTDVNICRVEFGGDFARGLALGFQGGIRGLYFIAEKRNDEVRAGFMSEPLLPIGGDIQVRVDQSPLKTITLNDTPIDVAPSYSIPNLDSLPLESQEAIKQSFKNAAAISSPYRLYTGDRALEFLREITSGQKVIWRVVTVNAAASLTGEIRVKGLQEALGKCGINL